METLYIYCKELKKEKFQGSITESGIKKAGKLLLRLNLPAAVLLDSTIDDKVIEVQDTTALSFDKKMYFEIHEIERLNSQFVGHGVVLIPTEAGLENSRRRQITNASFFTKNLSG